MGCDCVGDSRFLQGMHGHTWLHITGSNIQCQQLPCIPEEGSESPGAAWGGLLKPGGSGDFPAGSALGIFLVSRHRRLQRRNSTQHGAQFASNRPNFKQRGMLLVIFTRATLWVSSASGSGACCCQGTHNTECKYQQVRGMHCSLPRLHASVIDEVANSVMAQRPHLGCWKAA